MDAFSPVMSYERPKKGSRSQLAARVLSLLLAAGVVYVLYTHSPDAESLKAGAKEAHDSILDYLVREGGGRGIGAGNVRGSNPKCAGEAGSLPRHSGGGRGGWRAGRWWGVGGCRGWRVIELQAVCVGCGRG